MTGPFVLGEDVEIVPVASLSAAVRAQIEGGDGDFTITRPHTRTTSKVINSQAAEFLRQFQQPTTLVDAIVRFGKAVQRKPTQVLEDVFPFLESCLIDKLLVEPGSAAAPIRSSFERGALVANYTVLRCVHVLVDTELYRVRAADREVALKILRRGAGQQVKQGLEREAKILARLGGRIAPQLFSSGETGGGRTYLALEWVPGELCGEAAAAIRASTHESLPESLVSMCSAILDAYVVLHDWGVIHSDVHPSNVLVGAGTIRIIDYGLARVDGENQELAWVPRGGVPHLLEPEYAKAILSGSPAPLSSYAGEQYSVAALIYFLLTGRHHVDFSCVKEVMFHQIAENPPVSLWARGLTGATEVEKVLFRALSKDASSRFPDMRAMATEFRDAAAGSRQSAQQNAPGAERRYRNQWLESFLNMVSDPTIDLMSPSLGYPTASLSFGATGIAYGLFRIAGVREDAGLVALASRWLDRACREARHELAFYTPDTQMTPATVGRVSPYHTPSGMACVQALLAHGYGDSATRATATERFLQLSDQDCENPDVSLGRAGTLLTLSSLADAFRWDKASDDLEKLIEAGNKLCSKLWAHFDAMPPIADSSPSTFLGIAHGWAGYLYATLRWMKTAGVEAPATLKSRLHELAQLAQRNGLRAFWPRMTGPNSSILGGWCNGSAGFVFLWELAHRVTSDPQWLSLAEGVARDACHSRDEGPSLCCGLTGKAYSQLCLYKHTGDRIWLENASNLCSLAVRKSEISARIAEPRLPLSLYKGDLGLAVLVSDLERPESALMPFFEDEAWPARS